jgi:peptidoglycan hydrolase-like protein with peptidoglycan-binding domain
MIRWCLFQQRRLTYLREKFDGSGDAVDASTYNDMVDDYGDRCAAFKYVESDMNRVRAEIAAKEVDLKADAARIWAGWLRKPPVVSAAPTSDPPKQTASPTVGKEQVGLDLLRMEDARKVQQRLISLKYLTGSADGLWTSRCRSALREFKMMNGLARDDLFDVLAENALFSASALKKVDTRPSGNRLKEAPEPEGKYPPPPGASLNPLNKGDAITLQKRLYQLGFFKGNPNGVWGLVSRSALRDFKAVSNLAQDDQWDSNTEQALMADGSVRASETFIGGWGDDQSDCGPTQPGGARLRIDTRQAEAGDVTCRFVTIAREDSGWRVAAECAKPGKKWSSDVKLEASAGRLTWTSNGETSTYLRCR